MDTKVPHYGVDESKVLEGDSTTPFEGVGPILNLENSSTKMDVASFSSDPMLIPMSL